MSETYRCDQCGHCRCILTLTAGMEPPTQCVYGYKVPPIQAKWEMCEIDYPGVAEERVATCKDWPGCVHKYNGCLGDPESPKCPNVVEGGKDEGSQPKCTQSDKLA